MSCPFCGAASNPRWAGGYLCGTIDDHQSSLCGSLVRYGERIVMVSEIDALKARIARLEEAGDDLRVCCESVVSGSEVAKSVKRWTEAKETKP